jgi:chromosome segregation ATPase
MNIDPNTALLAAGAAALFVGGGVVLGSAFGRDPKGNHHRPPPDPEPRPEDGALRDPFAASPGASAPNADSSVDGASTGGRGKDTGAEEAAAEARKRTEDSLQALETERTALRERLEQNELEVKEARADAARLASDLDSKHSIIQQMGAWLDEARQKVRAAEGELAGLREAKQKLSIAEDELTGLRRAREVNETLETKPPTGGGPPRIPRPESMRAPDSATFATLRAELGELRKKLDLATGGKEAAEAKAKALETLIEAARARSRELAKELEQLKAGKGGS